MLFAHVVCVVVSAVDSQPQILHRFVPLSCNSRSACKVVPRTSELCPGALLAICTQFAIQLPGLLKFSVAGQDSRQVVYRSQGVRVARDPAPAAARPKLPGLAFCFRAVRGSLPTKGVPLEVEAEAPSSQGGQRQVAVYARQKP